jgi:hypothetical protein
VPNIDRTLKEEVSRYNKYMDQSMECVETDPDYYTLLVGGYEITTGDIVDMVDRIKGINRENGLSHL